MKEKDIRVYELETYSMLKNIDETILKLNPIIKERGFEFVGFSIAELENQFYSLFYFSPENEKGMRVRLNGGMIISERFSKIMHKHPLGGFSNLSLGNGEGKAYFLKRIDNTTQKVVNNIMQDSGSALGETRDFTDELVRKLRLFKNGDIRSLATFHIHKESRHVGTRVERTFDNIYADKIYKIDDTEISALKVHLLKGLKSTDLTKLAESYFDNSYLTFDFRMKFVNLITALESLFNRGKDQISHIISRHLALVISENKKEFEDNYKRIKKIYNIRSQIVHGQKLKANGKNIMESMDELQNLTRKAIVFCIQSGKGKDELFSYFNAKGFSD